MRQGSKGLARGRAATRGSGGTHRGVLSAAEVAGLGLLLAGMLVAATGVRARPMRSWLINDG